MLMIITVLGSTAVWVTVTFLTAPEKDDVLIKFYSKVQPAGYLWNRISIQYNLPRSGDSLAVSLRDWIMGVLFIYCFLFAIGSFLFGNPITEIVLMMMSGLLGYLIWKDLKRI